MKNNSKIKIEKFGEYIVYTNEKTKKRITIGSVNYLVFLSQKCYK